VDTFPNIGQVVTSPHSLIVARSYT